MRLREPRPGLAAFGVGGLFLLLLAILVWTKTFPSAFDELEHVSYAAYLQETGQWRPMFDVMQTLLPGDITRWDQRPNYLGHPSPYYWYESLFLDRALPLHAAVTRVRLGSAALEALGVGLALWAGRRAFRQDWAAMLVFCGLVALCPKLLAVGGQVTNDVLAILAGGLAYWGLCIGGRRGWVAAGAGIMLACWAKPNAALAVGAVLGIYARFHVRERPAFAMALAMGAALGSVPYWPILSKYGSFVPITVEQFGQVHVVPGWEYVPAFVVTVAYTFCFAQTGTWPLPDAAGLVMTGLLWTMLSGVAAGGVIAFRQQDQTNTRLIAIAAPLAVLVVLPVHFWFSAVKLGGSLPAASFRYYLPIWPFMAHALAYGVGAGRRWFRLLMSSVVGASLLLGWLSP